MSCPLCRATDRRTIASQRVLDIDYEQSVDALREIEITYAHCPACGTVSQDPLPGHNLLDRYYSSIGMWRTTPELAAIREGILADRLELLRRITDLADGNCLEVGCGDGGFLEMIQREWGLTPWGLEPSDTYDTECSFPVLRGTLEAIDTGTAGIPAAFDLVVCRHVLEHVHLAGDFLDRLTALVVPDGWLYLEVPSGALHAAADDAVVGLNLHPLHLHHYTGPGLVAALQTRGLDVRHGQDRGACDYPSLCLTACRSGSATAAPTGLDPRGGDELFLAQFERQTARYRRAAGRLADLLQPDPSRVLVWGAGADLFGVLQHLDKDVRAGLRLHDGNPAKQGKTLGGVPVLDVPESEAEPVAIVVPACSNRTLYTDIAAAARERFPTAVVGDIFDETVP